MKNKTMRIANYLLAVIGFVVVCILYPSLPDQIPMNWDFNGNVSYSGKSQIFMFCGMAILFAVMFDILPKIDPRRKNYQKFGAYYDSFCVIMQIFLLIMDGIVITEAFRPGTVSVPMVVNLAVGLLLLFIGNITPKIKSNFYMGIKTPWTLSSEDIWYKTHRLGGKCFFIAGLIMIVSAFIPFEKGYTHWITLACVMIAATIPMIMSYIWWRQEQMG